MNDLAAQLRRRPRRLTLASVGLASLASACEPHLAVGTWDCPAPRPTEDGGIEIGFDVPWRTGFETGFCDYERTGGYCYGDPGATYRIIDAPVHGGHQAAAFGITTDPALDGTQARCFLQGRMPVAATYGAWIYLPSPAQTGGNWNLFHLPSGAISDWHGVWDVSIDTTSDGTLFLYVLDALDSGARLVPNSVQPIPIASWFHVEFRLVRAKDATGEVALYQDGKLLVERSGIVTEDSDLGQWYVGNLATALTPTDSAVYVDDVTVNAVR